MKKPIEELDTDFDNRTLGLYVVVDNTTNVEISGVFTLMNDAAAVGGFVQFMAENKDKKKPFSKYVLKSVGLYDILEHKIITGESYDIISDDEDYEEYFKEICELVKGREDKE